MGLVVYMKADDKIKFKAFGVEDDEPWAVLPTLPVQYGSIVKLFLCDNRLFAIAVSKQGKHFLLLQDGVMWYERCYGCEEFYNLGEQPACFGRSGLICLVWSNRAWVYACSSDSWTFHDKVAFEDGETRTFDRLFHHNGQILGTCRQGNTTQLWSYHPLTSECYFKTTVEARSTGYLDLASMHGKLLAVSSALGTPWCAVYDENSREWETLSWLGSCEDDDDTKGRLILGCSGNYMYSCSNSAVGSAENLQLEWEFHRWKVSLDRREVHFVSKAEDCLGDLMSYVV